MAGIPKGTKFIVYYDAKGEVINVQPGEGCKLVDIRKYAKKGGLLVDFLKEKGELLEVKTTPLLHVHSSPGCWIIVGGRPFCICCG